VSRCAWAQRSPMKGRRADNLVLSRVMIFIGLN
jgi:hypothetical protein